MQSAHSGWCPGRCPLTQNWPTLESRFGDNFSAWGATSHQSGQASRCDLCARRWLFIVSIGGRTGSTTLLRMLNEHPSISLAGENSNQLADAMTLWHKASMQRYDTGVNSRGKVSPPDLLCDLQHWFEDVTVPVEMEPSSSNNSRGSWATASRKLPITGFKEIRWRPPALTPTDMVDSHSMENRTTMLLDFAEMLFPCAKFIFNARENVTAAVQDRLNLKWYGGRAADARKGEEEAVDRSARHMAAFRAKHLLWHTREAGLRSFWLPLERFSLLNFNKMLRWMGEDGCEYDYLLHDNHHGYMLDDSHAEGAAIARVESCVL